MLAWGRSGSLLRTVRKRPAVCVVPGCSGPCVARRWPGELRLIKENDLLRPGELALHAGAGEGNRTLMTSLEG